MAVYTPVSAEQINDFLENYDLGTLESHEGIAQGVSNTNYHLYTDRGHYILTLFEPGRVDAGQVPFFLAYAEHLAKAGIPSATAVANHNEKLHGELADRPASVMTFLEGEHPQEITPDMCGQLATLAARMHLAGETFDQQVKNSYGPARWKQWVKDMGHELNDICFGLYDAMRGELMELNHLWPDDLPQGAIHADLFPDNVFFKDGTLTGVIDFHFACTDFLAYDLAIVVNAWCFDEHTAFVQERYDSLLKGYEDVRLLTDEEKRALPLFLRGAALRFVLSRCEEMLAHKPGDLMHPHDPQVFIKRLEHWQGE